FQLLLEDSKFGEWRIRVRLTFAPVGASLDVFRTQGRIPVGPLIARLALGSVGTVLLASTIRPVGALLVLARSATRGSATLLTSILALLRRGRCRATGRCRGRDDLANARLRRLRHSRAGASCSLLARGQGAGATRLAWTCFATARAPHFYDFVGLRTGICRLV